MAVRIATTLRNAMVQQAQILTDAGPAAGKIEVRTGTQPATPETAATGTLLATIVLGDPSYGAPATGVITGADPAPVTAVASGTATWCRQLDSTGAAVLDGDVTATGGGGYLQLATTTLSTGLSVDVTSLSLTQPAT